MAYMYVIPEKNHLPVAAKTKIQDAINPVLAYLDSKFDGMTANDLAVILVNATVIATDKHTMAAFKEWFTARVAAGK